MTEQERDTVRLLRECDAEVKMGISSMDEVLEHIESGHMKRRLSVCREEHEALDTELQELLDRRRDGGKEPNPIAKGMSWMKTNMKLGWDGSDRAIAELMTDGCNMGVKSLSQYLNRYRAADGRSREIARRLIRLEEGLAQDLRPYL